MPNNLLGAVIWIIVALVLIYVLRLILPFFGLPAVVNQVIMILVGLVCVIAILRAIFGFKWPY